MNQFVGFNIDISSCFINEHNSLGVQQGTGDVNELLFPGAQIAAALGYLGLKSLLLLKSIPNAAQVQCTFDFLIFVVVGWVYVGADSP